MLDSFLYNMMLGSKAPTMIYSCSFIHSRYPSVYISLDSTSHLQAHIRAGPKVFHPTYGRLMDLDL